MTSTRCLENTTWKSLCEKHNFNEESAIVSADLEESIQEREAGKKGQRLPKGAFKPQRIPKWTDKKKNNLEMDQTA